MRIALQAHALMTRIVVSSQRPNRYYYDKRNNTMGTKAPNCILAIERLNYMFMAHIPVGTFETPTASQTRWVLYRFLRVNRNV